VKEGGKQLWVCKVRKETCFFFQEKVFVGTNIRGVEHYKFRAMLFSR